MTQTIDLPGSAQLAESGGSARRIVERLFARGGIRVGGPDPWDLQVRDARVFERILAQGSLGMGESYMEGWWDCPHVDQLIDRVTRFDLESSLSPSLRDGLTALRARLFNPQSFSRAHEGVRHYQASTAFFQALLGPTMNYSCAYWRRAGDVDEAQEHKMELIARKLGIGPRDSVLDIGCGWGGFARWVASHIGCSVVGVTLSEQQAVFAREFCKGLPVEILLADYRSSDLRGPFDKIVSVGMFEHVGRKNHRIFMEVAHRLLGDGLLLLQTIGSARSDLARDPWLDRYIFPNHLLPTPVDITRAAFKLFVMEDWHNFGADYDRTLMAWHANFEKAVAAGLGPPDEPARRMWRYYLLSCAGSFRARRTNQLWQLVFSKEGVPGGYASVR
jgi:cyclopropane-fatty-acyl-phospholipid synthase